MRLQGGRLQSDGEAHLAQVSVDGLRLVVDVEVLPFGQLLLDLLAEVQDLLVGQGSATVVVVGDAIHEGVLLQVHHGPEQVVPQGEAEGPGFGSTLHGRRPRVDFHLGGLGVPASSRLLQVAAGSRLAVLDVGTGHADQRRDAGTRADLLHDGDLLPFQVPHAVAADGHLAVLAERVLAGVLGVGLAAMILRAAQDVAEAGDGHSPVVEVGHVPEFRVAGEVVVVLQVLVDAEQLMRPFVASAKLRSALLSRELPATGAASLHRSETASL